MKHASTTIIFGCAIFVAGPVFATKLKCTGQESGINTLTGMKRTIPATYHIEITNDRAIIKEMGSIIFSVKQNKDRYRLKASIGKRRLMGEYNLEINKHTGYFKSKSWLFSRRNIVSSEGRCESIESKLKGKAK